MFEQELNELIERANNIKSPINVAPIGVSIDEYNKPSQDWINDVEIFYNKYLKNHALGTRISTLLFHRNLSAFNDLRSCLDSINRDKEFVFKMNAGTTVEVPMYKSASLPEYDVFISHANKDKLQFVDELNDSLTKLGISIFYDKNSLEWGDKWKKKILEGTQKAEFAIIVISKNFFDREWTEKELIEFLNRQNKNGQKIILPIVHGISNDDLRNMYPEVADIQTIDSKDYSCDEIALLFARQLIQRLKSY
ncbi:TIR domain-containing protein [Pseudobutyrivibrio sp. 49]|uniref:toll/interleukin-1 receptor domain-containing protein n=1 Tax=Pseudobutyrivibrio sp. 49 TaxID=1855344 RepID=UPI00087F5ADA|nr:toll/interleukin-1 receptor domain-containing protein [Pseudobutyrivibrio sp. 49]SDI57180.1 TIR domain-containing protein [Pseudobutyrivibrio sp. 49]